MPNIRTLDITQGPSRKDVGIFLAPSSMSEI
jgi:hypothetical protein